MFLMSMSMLELSTHFGDLPAYLAKVDSTQESAEYKDWANDADDISKLSAWLAALYMKKSGTQMVSANVLRWLVWPHMFVCMHAS